MFRRFRFGLLLKDVYLKLYRNTLDGLNEMEEEFWGHKYQRLFVLPTLWKQQFKRSLKCSLNTQFLKDGSSSSYLSRSGIRPHDGGWYPWQQPSAFLETRSAVMNTVHERVKSARLHVFYYRFVTGGC